MEKYYWIGGAPLLPLPFQSTVGRLCHDCRNSWQEGRKVGKLANKTF